METKKVTVITAGSVTIESGVTDYDDEIREIAMQVAKVIEFTEGTNDPGLALSIAGDDLSELRGNLKLRFKRSGLYDE